MATTRSNANKKKPGGRTAPPHDRQAPPAQSLSDTAQQIWLAGIGALARAQAESSKLFEGLVKDGRELEKSATEFAGHQAEVMREAVETGIYSARERATGTWGHLETAVEGGVRRALNRIGVPDRDDIAELRRQVDALSAQLRSKGAPRAASATAAPAKKAATKTATRKPAASKAGAGAATPRKTATRTSGATKSSAKKTSGSP